MERFPHDHLIGTVAELPELIAVWANAGFGKTALSKSANLKYAWRVEPKLYAWNEEKNQRLKAERNVSFEEVVFHIASGHILDVIEHPNQERYEGQRIFIVNIDDYAYLVPFVETDDQIFLKTIIPNRKATRKYLGGKHGKK